MNRKEHSASLFDAYALDGETLLTALVKLFRESVSIDQNTYNNRVDSPCLKLIPSGRLSDKALDR